MVNFDSPSSLRIAIPLLAVTLPPCTTTVAEPPFVSVSIPIAEDPVPPVIAPLKVRVMSPAPSVCALMPAPAVDPLAVTAPVVVIEISPAPVL